MSFPATAWAIAQNDLKVSPKCVLIILASMADQDESCYPGIPLLATTAGLSESSTRDQVKFLLALGLITQERRYRKNGARTSNRYYLQLAGRKPPEVLAPDSGAREPDDLAPDSGGDLAPDSGGGLAPDSGGVIGTSQFFLTGKRDIQSSGSTFVNGPVDNFSDDDLDDDPNFRPSTPRDTFGKRRSIDLAALAAAVGHVFAAAGIDEEQLGRLAGMILGRAKFTVTDPTAYVIAAIRSDPHEWQSQAFDLAASAAQLAGNDF